MTLLTALKDTFNSGDPIVRKWALVESFWTPLICCSLYVLFVKRLGPAFMRNRKPFDLRFLMIIYNFTIVLIYAMCLLVLTYYFLATLTTDAYKLLCSPNVVIENHYTYTCSCVGWVIYAVKYAEFADTVFFVLRKKDHLITNLHVIHHTALPCLGWFMMRTETSGFQFIPAGINSFVHTIMYTYYGLAAMGPEMQKKLWWKEYLTLLQMAQFVVILLFVFVVLPVTGCKTKPYGVYIDIIFATLFLALFFNFYSKTYKKSTKLFPYSISNGVNSKISNDVNSKSSNGAVPNGINGVHQRNGQCLKES